MDFKSLIKTKEYDFLRNNEHLGDNIILLGLGGSHAYGTNIEGSDVDIRGCALNRKADILTNQDFKQFVNEETDTTIYSFNKLITLLTNVNPNTIEMLGLKPEHYLYMSKIGEELLNNKKLFLSRKCIHSFGGYANQQLYRLKQKSKHQLEHDELEQHILKTLDNIQATFGDKYGKPEDSLKLYIDSSNQEKYDTEIFMDINLKHYPLRDYNGMLAELQQTVRQYGKVGVRNSKAIEHGKINKHMMHLIRLYLMCFDILEKEEIVTYREKEHDFLMDVRNGKYTTEDNQVLPEFYDIVNEYEKRLEYDKNNTSLPDKPDYKKINEFVMDVNWRVVRY